MSAKRSTRSLTPRHQSEISAAHDLSVSDLMVWSGLSRNKIYGHMSDAVDPMPFYRIGPRKIFVNKEEYTAWRARRFASSRADPAIAAPRRRRRTVAS